MTEMTGSWQGRNSLWLYPGDPVHESDSTADVGITQNGQYTEIAYTWAYDGDPQVGRLFIGQPAEDGAVKAVWFDSWHLRDSYMVFKGTGDGHGSVTLDGSYPAPEGPDWGWQIAIEPAMDDKFTLRMYNIPPGVEKVLAVEVEYSRRS